MKLEDRVCDFTNNWDRSKPLILCFSTMRSGSTKLLNVFRAASEALEIDVLELKMHSLGYDIANLDCNNVGRDLILVSSRRKLLDQAISLARTSSWNKNKEFPKKFIPLFVNKVIEERVAEIRVLEKCLVGGVSFFSCDYSCLDLASSEELILLASNFISAALNGTNLSEVQKAIAVEKASILSSKYALDLGKALEISTTIKNFEEIDDFTHIHGDHISRQNDPTLLGIKRVFDEFGFAEYAEKIDSFYIRKIEDLCLCRLNDGRISKLQVISKYSSS